MTVAVVRQSVQTLTLRASDLTNAEHAALTTLLDSPQVYRQYPSGQLQPVYVVPGTSPARSSAARRHTFDLTIELPRRNALTN